MKNSRLCEQCRTIAGHYTDEVRGLDDELNLLAELCLACENPETPSPELLESIGGIVARQLDQRLVLQHYFFDRTLRSRALGPAFLKGEFARLNATWEHSARSKRVQKKKKK
jgi:hypothetical protein